MTDPYELLDKAVLEYLGNLDMVVEEDIVKYTISALCEMGLIDYDMLKEWAWQYEEGEDD